MKKVILALAIGTLAVGYAHAAEPSIAPTVSPITETPAYLKQDKPAESPSATPVPDGLPRESKEQRDARMAWWRDARFGMFIHWGVYARLGGIYDGKEIPSLGEQIMGRGEIPVPNTRNSPRSSTPRNTTPKIGCSWPKRPG